MSASEANSVQEALVRLGAPLVAAWLWERSMVPERRAQRAKAADEGRKADGFIARITRTVREQVLARLGVTAPDQSALEIRQDRALADVVKLTLRIETLRGRFFWNRRIPRLQQRRAEALRLSGAPEDFTRQHMIVQQLAVIQHASDLDRPISTSPWHAHQTDTATRRHGDTVRATSRDTVPAATPIATRPATPATPDTTPQGDTDTDTPAATSTDDAPKAVATRPRPGRVETLPVHDLDTDIALLRSANGSAPDWARVSKADAIRHMDRILPDRTASQVVKLLAAVDVKVDNVLVRKTRSRDRQNGATTPPSGDTADEERVA